MNILAISRFNSNVNVLNFGKRRNNENNKMMDNSEMDLPSKNASKAMRNAALGTIAALASMPTAVSLPGCAEAEAWNDCCCCDTVPNNPDKDPIHDTIYIPSDAIHDTTYIHDTAIVTDFKPVYVRNYPFNISDSIIEQGVHIGVPVKGPVPDGSGKDSVVYIGSKAFNRYDSKYYEDQIDSANTNNDQLTTITKIVDLYSSKNPTTIWMKQVMVDDYGKGIKFYKYVSDSETKPRPSEWNYAGYEIRSLGRNGKFNGLKVYDNNNELIYSGRYNKGETDGTFLYSTVAHDPATGEIITDENNEPQLIDYDFKDAIIYTAKVKMSEDPENPGWSY